MPLRLRRLTGLAGERTVGTGHSVIVAESEGARGLEAGLVRNLLDGGVGRFVYAAMATRRVVVPEAIKAKGVVLLNYLASGTSAPAIVPDERAAGALSVETLVAAGHSGLPASPPRWGRMTPGCVSTSSACGGRTTHASR